MGATATQRSPLRPWLIVVAAIVATVFVSTNLDTFISMGAALGTASPRHVVAGVCISIVAMANRGLLSHAAHRSVGLSADPVAISRTAAVAFAANKILTSGGASGLAVFLRHGRRNGQPRGTVAASCLVTAVASAVAMGAVLASVLLILSWSGQLSGWWLAAAIGFGVYAAAMIAVGTLVLRDRRLTKRAWAWSAAKVARIRRRPHSGSVDTDLVDDLHDALALAARSGHWSRRAVAHALLSKALGAAVLLTSAHAVGVSISPRDAVIVYAAALAAGFVALVPGGVGVVEASTGAILVAAGADLPTAAAAVTLFRFFDLWLPVAAGLVAGRSEMRGVSVPTVENDPAHAPALPHPTTPYSSASA